MDGTSTLREITQIVIPLACAPIVVFGWLCQRQRVQGLTFGAVK